MFVSIPLSKLVADRRNPRRVKPNREAHDKLVASIRAHGLLAPLVVRPDGPRRYRVVAGRRRFDAYREVHPDPKTKVLCRVKKMDDATADAVALAENFAREPMHPLDEAEAFAKLARFEGKGVEAIAAEFGVLESYVRQRMKLAALAGPVRTAYRADEIDTATAEAFAAVPPERQVELWQETGGQPRHAQHVRNLIEHAWIDAKHAVFDVKSLPEGTVSGDLFQDRVLVERKAFMAAQTEALHAERHALSEDGWAESVVAEQHEVQDLLLAMTEAPREYEPEVADKLAKLQERHEKLEVRLENARSDKQAEKIAGELEQLEEKAVAITKDAAVHYAEPTKAVGTAILILSPDGQVRREYRVRRTRSAKAASNGSDGNPSGSHAEVPAVDDLSDRQSATAFAHEALSVREAVLADKHVRRVVLAMILHEKVLKESLSIRRDANSTDLHVAHTEGFRSKAFEELEVFRGSIDPISSDHVEEVEAFELLAALSDKQLDEFINVLAVQTLSAHPLRPTLFVKLLAQRLKVNVRRDWLPDEAWLAGYQKIQLAELLGALRGSVHGGAAQSRKKSELVAELAKLFADAAEGRVGDNDVASRVNAWLPARLQPEPLSAKESAE